MHLSVHEGFVRWEHVFCLDSYNIEAEEGAMVNR